MRFASFMYRQRMTDRRHSNVLLVAPGLLLGLSPGLLPGLCGGARAQSASPAELISSFRLAHGEGKVSTDPALNRIAHEQAAAMAAKDVLDHSVLGPFGSRVAPYGSRRSAENIAFGYDNFPKTLDQWIASSAHRSNLLLHGATRVGVASAKSTKTGRTYWAMVIAEERPKQRRNPNSGLADTQDQDCRIALGSLCLY